MYKFLPVCILSLVTLFFLPTDGLWSWYPPAHLLPTMPESLFLPSQPTTSLPAQLPDPQLPPTQAYLVLVNQSNAVLLANNEHAPLFPASTTKIVTAVTALNSYALQETIEVPADFLSEEGKGIGLLAGQTFTVSALLEALLVHSANDVAQLLADHHPKGQAGFVGAMNEVANHYGLTASHFTNPHGLHNQEHFVSAYDLAQFSRLALRSPIIRRSVSQKTVTVYDTSRVAYQLENTNELLGQIPEVKGIKTGWTPEAGECFVGLVKINGQELITVVLGSTDRFLATQKLIDWAKQALGAPQAL